jgi:hypothetical protein
MGEITAEEVIQSQGTSVNGSGFKVASSTKLKWEETVDVFGSSPVDLATFAATYHESYDSRRQTTSVDKMWDECNLGQSGHHGYAPRVQRTEGTHQSGTSTGKAHVDLGSNFGRFLDLRSYKRSYWVGVVEDGPGLTIDDMDTVTVKRLDPDPCAKGEGGTESTPGPSNLPMDHLVGEVMLAFTVQMEKQNKMPIFQTGRCNQSCTLDSGRLIIPRSDLLLGGEKGTAYQSIEWHLRFKVGT